MGIRPPAPASLDEMVDRADVLAVVEITERYELPGPRSIDEKVTRRMATATVTTPISGSRAGQELEIYVSRVSEDADGKRGPVLGGHHDEQLFSGARLLAALVEDEPGLYELSGGELLIRPDGRLLVLGRDNCLTPDEVALSQEIVDRSLPDIITRLEEASASTAPDTRPTPTLPATTS